MIEFPALTNRTTYGTAVLVILASAIGAPGRASDRDAAEQVRQGVRWHRAGDFEQAAQAFSQAAEKLPADPRIAFNHGCALAAQGKHDEAEALLREAALAKEPGLAAAAYYNLGCLAADQMKTLFGDQPEEAVAPTREEGLQLVRSAVDHYRSALRADSEHAAARQNLELLRIWSKHIQDRWAERDRQRRREQMNLLEFLDWLQSEQRAARGLAKALPSQLATPQLRQTARKLSARQRDLTLEIDPLKAKIDQALQPPPDSAAGQLAGTPPVSRHSTATPPASTPPAPTPPPLSPELLQARKALHGLAEQAGQTMLGAADALGDRDVPAAIARQTESLPPLNQLFEVFAPFEAILQAAIKSETRLVELSKQATADGSASGAAPPDDSLDFEEAAEDQQFVAGWSRMLLRKAEQLLAEAAAESPGNDPMDTTDPTEIPLPTQEAEPSPTDPAPRDPAPTDPAPTDEAPTTTDATAATEEAAAPPKDPRAAYEKAVELGPRIEELTSQAAEDLQRDAWSAALPKQEESLELLKEIAALLPPQEQQDQDQEQQDQDQENQDDQEKQDQENQDQEKKQDDKQDNSSEDEKDEKQKQKSQDQEKADEKKSDEQQDKSKKQQEQSPEKLSRQQAESLLRQVREREREHREFEKEIRRLLQSRILVERDW